MALGFGVEVLVAEQTLEQHPVVGWCGGCEGVASGQGKRRGRMHARRSASSPLPNQVPGVDTFAPFKSRVEQEAYEVVVALTHRRYTCFVVA